MKCNIAQGFNRNANPLYKGDGLKGHTGIDLSCGWKSDVKALWENEYVYKIFSPENPASDGFTGIFTIVEQDGETFEFLYGHVGDIKVKEKEVLKQGQVIATEGAYGRVYSGGHECTDKESEEDGCGSHRHYQKRPIKFVSSTLTTKNYLQHNKYGIFRYKDQYCEVPDFNNGYNGCVDFAFPDKITKDTTDAVVKMLTVREMYKNQPFIYKAFTATIAFLFKLLGEKTDSKF